MAYRLVESFDWTTAAADVNTRYNVSSGGGAILTPGRFGGNCIEEGSTANTSYQLKNGPFGPRLVSGFNFFSNNLISFPIWEYWDGLFGSGGIAQVSLCFNAGSNHLEVRQGNNGALIATGTKVLLVNTWYWIEFDVLIGAGATGSATVAIEGANDIVVAGVTTQQSGAAQATHIMWLGCGNPVQFDDMYVKDTAGIIGPAKVTLQKPASDGAVVNWTPSSGVTHFNLVNEVPPDGDTSYVSTATAGTQDLYNFQPLPAAPQTIFTVQVSLYARKDDAAARSIATLVRSGGLVFVGATQTVSSTYSDFYTQIYDQDPNTAAAWTFAGFNAAQFGEQCIT